MVCHLTSLFSSGVANNDYRGPLIPCTVFIHYQRPSILNIKLVATDPGWHVVVGLYGPLLRSSVFALISVTPVKLHGFRKGSWCGVYILPQRGIHYPVYLPWFWHFGSSETSNVVVCIVWQQISYNNQWVFASTFFYVQAFSGLSEVNSYFTDIFFIFTAYKNILVFSFANSRNLDSCGSSINCSPYLDKNIFACVIRFL